MARPKGKIQRRQTGVRLRPAVYKAACHLAIDNEITVSALVESALVEYLRARGVEIPGE